MGYDYFVVMAEWELSQPSSLIVSQGIEGSHCRTCQPPPWLDEY